MQSILKSVAGDAAVVEEAKGDEPLVTLVKKQMLKVEFCRAESVRAETVLRRLQRQRRRRSQP